MPIDVDDAPGSGALPVAGRRSYHAGTVPPPRTKRRSFVLASGVAVGALLVGALGFVAGAGAAHAQARKKITLDDLVIEGNIQKPEAFFILPRTNLNFADLERREDLKTRIIKSVEKEPF
jgi:hypothetical protein